MDLSDHLHPAISFGKWKFLIGKVDEATSFVLLPVAIALSLVYIYMNWRNRKAKEYSLQATKSRSIPKLRHFTYFQFPILEGFYTLYHIRKDGLNAALRWAAKFKGCICIDMYLFPLKTIVLTDATACHKVLSSSDPGHLAKPQEWYGRILLCWLQKGLLNIEPDLWKANRKIVAKSFTFKALEFNIKIANKNGKKLAKRWTELSNDNDGVVQTNDLYDTLSNTVIRNIIEFMIGNGQSATVDVAVWGGLLQVSKTRGKDIVSYRLLHPELFIAPIWCIHPKKWELNDILRRTHSFVMQVIKTYEKKILSNPRKAVDKGNDSDSTYEEHGEDKCLVESLLYHGASSEQIYFEVGTILAAGHETTKTSIIFLLLDLALNLNHQAKCREEVDSLFNKKALDSDFDLHLNMGDISELKYLERCFLESMRLTPPVPLFLRRMDTPLRINDDTIIEKGSNVIISPWLIHKDPKHYPNPEKFDPDRFLPENVKSREPGSYIPFSAGPRNCIGWKAGINQVKVIMTWILRNFEISCVDHREEVKLLFDITTKPEIPYNIILKRRT